MKKEETIQYVGVDQLTESERAILDKLSTEYHEKIRRLLNNMTSLVVHVKEYKKEGARKKYSIGIRAVAPTQIFQSTKAADWDFARTLHKAFKDIEREITHALHTDDQRPRVKKENKPW